MNTPGTLAIRRLDFAAGTSQGYRVTFSRSSGFEVFPPYRCSNEFALLRLLEDLLRSPDDRLKALEEIRDGRDVSLPDLAVPEPLLAKYGFSAHEEPVSRGRVGIAPRCAVCSLPTTPNNRLTTLSGDVVHYECRPEPAEVLDAVARFIRGAEGQAYCHTCLAGVFHISFEEARKIVGRLRVRTGFRFGTGRCSVCGKHRITLGGSAVVEA